MAKKIVTVYIGRFQPLHLGHVHVLEHALGQSDLVVVLVGSAHQARTIKNPFTFDERKRLIERWELGTDYDSCISILPLRDQPYNDAKWIQSVQELVASAICEQGFSADDVEIRVTGSDRDESTWYLSAFPQWKSDLLPKVPEGRDLSATTLRTRLFDRKSIWDMSPPAWMDVPSITYGFLVTFIQTAEYDALQEEFDFIEKYRRAWEVAPYAPTFVTVDAIVVQSGHVLVVERGALPGKGLWALPGGFVNQNERLQKAVIRELVEETGIKVPAKVLEGSIRAHEIFDDPTRSLRGRTITTAFLIRLDDTQALPKVKGQNAPLHETGGKQVVETAKAFWLPISEARKHSDRWFEDHHALLDWGIGSIKD